MSGGRKENSVQTYIDFMDYVINDFCEPAYSGENGPRCSQEEIIQNLLSDLLHYCKAKDIPFSDQLNKAQHYFTKEREKHESALRRREEKRKKVSQ
jgi:hypothetical protein